jgi:pimeloyl-ACP methyl ester carboxylesterase
MMNEIRAAVIDPRQAVPVPEEELFLGAGEQIFATHYRAAGSAFLVIVPPLFEEHARTRKILVNMARELASSGIDAIRFDYPGTGLSGGSSNELSLADATGALRSAVEYATVRGARRIDLLGFRFGGYLAATLARELPATRLVLWEPIFDLGVYFQDLLRVEATNQVVTFGKVLRNRDDLVAELRAGRSVLLDGNRVSPVLYRDLIGAPAFGLAEIAELDDRALLLLWESKKLHDQARRCGLRTELLADVRFSWKHIRTLEPRSSTLFRLSREAVLR